MVSFAQSERQRHRKATSTLKQLIQNANTQSEPRAPTIHISATPGCRSMRRPRHLSAQKSPWPQLRCPIPHRLTIRHFRIRSSKPGHRAASNLDNRKRFGPRESCSFWHFAECFKETASYNHVLQLKFLLERDACISLISQKMEGSKPATTVLFVFPKYH